MNAVEPVSPKVLLVTYDFNSINDGTSLRQLLGWKDPKALVRTFVKDIERASSNYCSYKIVKHIEIDGFPVKKDGFRYSAEGYLNSWRANRGFHHPDWADYGEIVRSLNIIQLIQTKVIDEVWLFAGPYAGFYESRMAGPGAYWCNAPSLEGFYSAGRRFITMGFNYERGVGEMLESYGHRVESIMNHHFNGQPEKSNHWELFTRHHKTHPGQAHVGTIHYAPNSRRDYDWGNKAPVPSCCDNWLSYPDLSGQPKSVDSSEWGNGDIRQHHLWWLKHLPHFEGAANGTSNNWWRYIVDPN